MQLTSEQQKAVEGAVSHVKQGYGAYTVAGLAGTGKTVTLIETVRELCAQGYRTAVCTPTGKAANVINTKAPHLGTTTLHSRLCIFENDTIMQLRAKITAVTSQPSSQRAWFIYRPHCSAIAAAMPERVTLRSFHLSGDGEAK